MAIERRHKFSLFLVWRLRSATNLLSLLAVNVRVIGSGSLPLPVTLSRVTPSEDLGMAEAPKGRVPTLEWTLIPPCKPTLILFNA